MKVIEEKEKKIGFRYLNIYFSIWNILSLSIILALLNNLYFSDSQIVFQAQEINILGLKSILDTSSLSWIFIIVNLIIFILTNIHSFFKIKGLFLALTLMTWPFLPLTIFNFYYMIKNRIF